MLTNPGLFNTISPAGTGFTLPTLPINPADLLRENFELEDEEAERSIAPAEKGVVKEEKEFSKQAIDKLSERIMYVHQQMYLMFVLGMFGSIFAGTYIVDIIKFLFTKTVQLISAIFYMVTSCIVYLKKKIVAKYK
jgi:hypothetical protein